MLVAVGVLLRRPADRLMQDGVPVPAVSIGLNAAWIWLCWLATWLSWENAL